MRRPSPPDWEKIALVGLIRTLWGKKNAFVKNVDDYIPLNAMVIARRSQLARIMVKFVD
jgi:hypothetical protein